MTSDSLDTRRLRLVPFTPADLLTLLQLNPSLPARRTLARELGYRGALTGWASVDPMDLWLHDQIIDLLHASHGIIPTATL